ncbi:MAG: hypothetical protein AB7G17_06045 [Phycisphaerales bacterium]
MSRVGDTAGPRPGGRGYWSRLMESPMRDVVRLRATGRCDVKGQVHRAGLPAEVEALVLRVVRKTRLWRLEKADVARELVAHFSDGLEAGRTAQELIEAFGDETNAARLIRRAKRRNRSTVWHAWLWTRRALGALVLVMLAGYGWLAYVYFTSKPVISHDYFADINAKAASWEPEQRAWPLYREAILAMRPWPEMTTKQCTSPVTCETHRPALTSWLAEHATGMALVREAASRPGMGLCVASGVQEEDRDFWLKLEVVTEESLQEPQHELFDGSVISTLLPHLGEMRHLTRLLAAEAVLAAERGDGERAAGSVVAIVRTAEHTREIPFLINDLVGVAQLALACDTASRMLHEHHDAFSAAQLRDMAHALSAHDGGGRVRVSLDGERASFHDFVQRAYSDDGDGNGRLVAVLDMFEEDSVWTGPRPRSVTSAAVGPLLMAASAPRHDLLARFDALLERFRAAGELPLVERRAEVARVESEFGLDRPDIWESNRYALVHLLTPSLTTVIAAGDLATMRRDAALTAIALELHRREHGTYPATLTELTPRHMPSVPEDRFVGRPMGYRLDEQGMPILYSVGNDGDDDGGRLSEGFKTAHEANDAAAKWQEITRGPTPDGDWILYPHLPREAPVHPEDEEGDE